MLHKTCEVTIAETTVVLRRAGSSRPLVANILGCEQDANGKRRIWLDRRLHNGSHQQLTAQWEGRGAISTVMVET